MQMQSEQGIIIIRAVAQHLCPLSLVALLPFGIALYVPGHTFKLACNKASLVGVHKQRMLVMPLCIPCQHLPEVGESGKGSIENFCFVGCLVVGTVVPAKRAVGQSVQTAAACFVADVEIQFLLHRCKVRYNMRACLT